ncbi:MAG: apolipoprotein N-acyltransferase [Planctomycetes bacterium]|nr:apolipoprotein N-acyltransferase [Planctomycetota bacterium]
MRGRSAARCFAAPWRALGDALRREISFLPLAGAVATGLLAPLAYPSAGLDLLILCSFVPLWAAVEGRSIAAGAFLGFTAGAVANAIGYGWIFHAIRGFAPQFPGVVAALFTGLWIGYESTYWAAIGAIAAWGLRGRGFRRIIPILAIVALETWYPRLFPWHLADSLYRRSRWVQIVEIGGPALLSLVILIVNAALFETFARLRARRRLPWAMLATAALLAGAIDLYGRIRLPGILDAIERAPARRARIVQPCIPVDDKIIAPYEPAVALRVARRILSLTGDGGGADLIVWPEAVVPHRLEVDGDAIEIPRWIPRTVPLIAGAPTFAGDPGESDIVRNSAFIAAPGQRPLLYHKVKLLLFGERIPFSDLPIVRRFVGLRSISPGDGPKVFEVAGERIGLAICYEGILTRYVRRLGRLGMTTLVNITEDGWYGRTSEPEQHLALVVLRAIENRVPVLRATNSGISASIDAAGRIVSTAPVGSAQALDVEFRPLAMETPYERYGPVTAGACAVVAAFAVGGFLLTRRRGARIL